MLDELIKLKDRFQPYLKNSDYTFIGPEEQGLFATFFSRANDLAPVVSFPRMFRHYLNNRSAAIKALDILPANTKLMIYVVNGSINDNLFHETIETYCKRNNIDFEL